MKKIYQLSVVLTLLSVLPGCEKFLDARADKTATVPSTLQDAQALLDNITIVNGSWMWITHLYSDELFVPNSGYNSATLESARLNYMWNDGADNGPQWMASFRRINVANTALAVLENVVVTPQNSKIYSDVRGQALFLRALSNYKLAQIFCPVYSITSKDERYGLPLILTESIAEPYVRVSLAETYAHIINDLSNAATLLPPLPAFKTRASKAAAYGQLAKLYLQIADYSKAEYAAKLALQIQPELMDYNQFNPAAAIPFQRFNKEVIYHSTSSTGISNTNSRVDTMLYAAYHNDDLRKQLFFQRQAEGYYNFKGNYDGQLTGNLFDGLSTGELYLVLAESRVYTGQTSDALIALNTLLLNRWKAGRFVPVAEMDKDLLLERIRQERRFELVYRGCRWADIRRYNRDGFARAGLKRILNGVIYELPLGDPRFTALVPWQVIEMGGVFQNPR
ncbi:MAG TPA: RagB/SusD family nutrient uptake outer membrane protein [Phnomibacter sp.]|nr:RagB/SusD family nutrient uptake outer membrane protein [Phnomibacter sp.]